VANATSITFSAAM